MTGRRRRSIRVFLLVLAFAAGAASLWWRRGRTTPDPDRIVVYGNVDVREVRPAFNGSEHIAALLVDEGDEVRRGQPIARLHTERLELAVAQAEARVASRRAVLQRLEAGSRPEEIARARAEWEGAQATARARKLTYERVRRLRESGNVSQEQVDEAEAAYRAAVAAEQAARQTLALAIAGPRAEDKAAARAELRLREAELAYQRALLRDAVLYAPVDGVVRERILEPGDMAFPQTPVFTIARLRPVWVRVFVPEPMLGRIRPGTPAEIRTDSFPDRVYHGRVGLISPTAEFTPKNVESPELRTRLVYQVRVDCPNPRGELRLGMPVTVTLLVGKRERGEARASEGGDRASVSTTARPRGEHE